MSYWIFIYSTSWWSYIISYSNSSRFLITVSVLLDSFNPYTLILFIRELRSLFDFSALYYKLNFSYSWIIFISYNFNSNSYFIFSLSL